jgi:F0F1-type ATP synthase delta subunit
VIYSDILRSIKTVDQASALNIEIDILIQDLFKIEGNFFEKTLNSISNLTSQMLKDAFLKENIGLENKSMIKEYLIGLKEQLQNLKTIKLSISFEPSLNSIDNLFSWVLKNQGTGIVLDLKTDKTILGGTTIEFEGKYKDLTLKKTLEETFQSKREEIMGLHEYQT